MPPNRYHGGLPIWARTRLCFVGLGGLCGLEVLRTRSGGWGLAEDPRSRRQWFDFWGRCDAIPRHLQRNHLGLNLLTALRPRYSLQLDPSTDLRFCLEHLLVPLTFGVMETLWMTRLVRARQSPELPTHNDLLLTARNPNWRTEELRYSLLGTGTEMCSNTSPDFCNAG